MTNEFLPTGYEIPVESNYMTFEEGDNTFRVLSSAVIGMEYWVADKEKAGKRKPIRKTMSEKILVEDLELNPKTGEVDVPSHFWAFVVYNRNAQKVQILEIKQKTIMRVIKGLVANPKWGHPTQYDITVTKTVSKGKTDYSITPNPKEDMDEGIVQYAKDLKIDLNLLFKGEDPFNSNSALTDEDLDKFAASMKVQEPSGV